MKGPARLIIHGDKHYITKLARHIYHEHPSTRRKIDILGLDIERRDLKK